MKDLSDGVYDAVKQFVDGYEQSDDLTMLCLRWKWKNEQDSEVTLA